MFFGRDADLFPAFDTAYFQGSILTVHFCYFYVYPHMNSVQRFCYFNFFVVFAISSLPGSLQDRILSCLDSSFANALNQFHQNWKTLWPTLVPKLRDMRCNADKMVDYINLMLLSESEDTSCLEPGLLKSK